MSDGVSTPATEAGPALSWKHAVKRLRHGVQWSTLGTVASQGSTLVVSVVAANVLGREVYGAYAIVLSTVATLSNISQLGMGYTATKFVAELRETDKARAGRVLGLGTLVSGASAGLAALGLALGASTLASEGYKAPQLAPALAIAAGVVLFAVVNGFLVGALCGLEAFRAAGYAGAASGAFYVAICLIGMHLGGLHGLLAGMAVSGMAQWALLRRCLTAACARQGIRITATGLRAEWPLLSRFAIPAMIGGASFMAATWAANTLLVRQEAGLSQFALLSAATSFWTALVFLPSIINNVGMAMLNNRRAAGAHAECRRIFWATTGINGALLLAGGGVLWVWAPECLGLFGPGFSGAATALRVLVVSAVAYTFWCSVTQVMSSAGGMWRVFLLGALPRDVVIVASAASLTPGWGAVGVAAAVTFGWTVGLAATLPQAWRSVLVRPHGTNG